jgi:undecaprenyl-diphosphatase
MIVFALILAVAERSHKANRGLNEVTLRDGLLVGIGQAFALVPGASRSGTTITAALFAGLERSTAARFSFLLSLPAIFAAGAKEFWDYHDQILASNLGRPMFIATVVAFVVGLASIDWLLKFLRTHPTTVFILYRIAVGLAILSLLAAGMIR